MKKPISLLCCSLSLIITNAQLKQDTAFKSNGNPIITHKYTADSAAKVYKDTFYLYTGHDVAPKDKARYEMHDWLCFSTTDMLNWIEHPSPMSRSIEGPWEYKGILNEIAGNSNTNHQAILEFKGKNYFVYHNGALTADHGSFHRSVCIDELFYNKDGTMKRGVMTSEGVKPVK